MALTKELEVEIQKVYMGTHRRRHGFRLVAELCIVKANVGELTMESKVGEGSAFVIVLPM